jgi:hypothetical protein
MAEGIFCGDVGGPLSIRILHKNGRFVINVHYKKECLIRWFESISHVF